MEIKVKVKFNVKRYFQVLGVTLGVLLAAALVALGINYGGGLDGEDVDNTSTVVANDGKINVLLMCTDVDGLRTDAVMLASYDSETGKVKILSVPRDTKMFVGNRYQKINAAHAFEKNGVIGGPTATCEAVNRITGIPINYYVDFTFYAVAQVVDELGPIDFTIPDLYGDGVGMVYDDPVQSLHINLPPGDYKLNGQQAVWVMRYRHGNYDPDIKGFKGYINGDKERMEMQQKLIKAIVDQKVNASMILKVPAIFQTISSKIKTNFTVKDIVKYSKYLTNFSSDKIESYELPGEFATDKSNGDVWKVDIEKTKELVKTQFGYDASRITVDDPTGAHEVEKDAAIRGASSSTSSGSTATAAPEKKTTQPQTGTSSGSSSQSNSSSQKSSQSSSSSKSSSSGTSSSQSGSSSGSSSSKSSSSGTSSGSSSGSTSSGGSSSSSGSSGSTSSSSSSSSGSSSGSSAQKPAAKDLDEE